MEIKRVRTLADQRRYVLGFARDREVTQTDIGREVRSCQARVCGVETGRVELPGHEIRAWAKAYGLSVGRFLRLLYQARQARQARAVLAPTPEVRQLEPVGCP